MLDFILCLAIISDFSMLRLSEIATHTADIKKSRFIATAATIASVDEAQNYIEEWHLADARHNCWAYRLGDQYRFFDDGEPGGSAGRPILSAIDGLGFDAVVAHVARYFGGIKLGVGGLVRAYSNTVKIALNNAASSEWIEMEDLAFLVDFSDTYAVYGVINAYDLLKIEEEYGFDGVHFLIKVEKSKIDNIKNTFIDATQARIKWKE